MHREGTKARRLLAAALALLVVSPLLGNHAQAETAQYFARIDRGNAAIAGGPMDAERAGPWTFSVELHGQVTDLFVQLWLPDRHGRCHGELIGSERFSSGSGKGKAKTYLAEGTYLVEIASEVAGRHCPRLIIWGEVGSTVSASVSSPSSDIVSGLPEIVPTIG